MSIYFTSDPHFFHANIIKPEYCNRPFAGVPEMNEALIANWNRVVTPEDTTYIVGDFAFAKPPRIAEIASQLNGRKILVLGNHDRRTRNKVFLNAGFAEVHHQLTLDLHGLKVLVSHYPYGYRNTPSYLSLKPEDKGLWLLCGHVHHHWKVRDRMINVGVDAWDFTPVPSTTLAAIIRGELQINYTPVHTTGTDTPEQF